MAPFVDSKACAWYLSWQGMTVYVMMWTTGQRRQPAFSSSHQEDRTMPRILPGDSSFIAPSGIAYHLRSTSSAFCMIWQAPAKVNLIQTARQCCKSLT